MAAQTIKQTYDLTTEEGILVYLAHTSFPGMKASRLSGGTANYVFRVELTYPAQGAFGSQKTVVAKHARGYLAGEKDWVLPVDRQAGVLPLFQFHSETFTSL